MLKLIFFLVFLMLVSFLYNMFWMFQNMLFLLTFFMINGNNYDYYYINMSYFVGCDLISYVSILWISSSKLMASEMIYKMKSYYKWFILNILLLLVFLNLAFSSNNLFLFYLFFESSLIPVLFLI